MKLTKENFKVFISSKGNLYASHDGEKPVRFLTEESLLKEYPDFRANVEERDTEFGKVYVVVGLYIPTEY